jgi:hypothetical protein
MWRCAHRERTPHDHEGGRLMTAIAHSRRFCKQEHLAAREVNHIAGVRLELNRAVGGQQQRGRGAGRYLRGAGWIEDASHQFEADGIPAGSHERFADERPSWQRVRHDGDRDQCDLDIEHEISVRATE